MTTIIVEGKTKSIYADSRQTKTTKTGNSNVLGFTVENNKSTEFNFIDDAHKVFYISKEVGYITATGDVPLLMECIRLSKEYNDFTLPDISKGYRSITIINVKLKGDCMDVVEYTPKTNSRWFGKENYWHHCWTLFTERTVKFYGSGSDYAQGAYEAGVDPENAIIAASRCDHCTNDSINKYCLIEE